MGGRARITEARMLRRHVKPGEWAVADEICCLLLND
jgi:hypothetical protein